MEQAKNEINKIMGMFKEDDFPEKPDRVIDHDEANRRGFRVFKKALNGCSASLSKAYERDCYAAKSIEACMASATLNKSMIFCGPVGTGKTLAACYAAARYEEFCFLGWPRDMAPPARHWNALGELQVIKAKNLRRTMSPWKGEPTEPHDALRAATVVILDDLGTERLDDWFLESLIEFVEYAGAFKKTCFITSNLSRNELAERYGERVTDRLRQGFALCVVKGESQREKRAGW